MSCETMMEKKKPRFLDIQEMENESIENKNQEEKTIIRDQKKESQDVPIEFNLWNYWKIPLPKIELEEHANEKDQMEIQYIGADH